MSADRNSSSYLGALEKWGTMVSYNAFAGLPNENLMAEMRNYLDVCPAIRCFSFHIYDHDRDGRREIMRQDIGYLAEGAIRPAIFTRLKLVRSTQGAQLLDSGAALGKIMMTPSEGRTQTARRSWGESDD